MEQALNIFKVEVPIQLGNLPFLSLQAVALIGLLGILLIIYRGKDENLQPNPWVYGLIIGLAGYALTGLVIHFIKLPSKPYLHNDVLFLAGLLGGIRGGLCGWALMLLGRFQFGGGDQFLAAVIDMSCINFAGIATHYWFKKKPIADFSLREISIAWAIKFVAAYLGPFLLLDSGLAPNAAIYSVMARRLVVMGISYALFAGMFLLFRIDREQRQARALQAELLRIDPKTGLPNRQAMQEHLNHYFGTAAHTPASLIIIEASNYVDMLFAEGLSWSDRLWREIDFILRDQVLETRLQPWSPRYFLFSETCLALVLHHYAVGELERDPTAAQLYQDINQRLGTLPWNGPAPQLQFGILPCDTGHYPDADACLSDIGLRLLGLHNEREAIRYYHRSFAESLGRQRRLQEKLLHWLAEKSLPLAYQPKFDLRTRRIVGAEALLRASDHEGAIPPGAILSMASNYQLQAALEWGTIEVAGRAARHCLNCGQPLEVSVNVSGALMGLTGFATRLQQLLRTLALPPAALVLELTENSPLVETDIVRENIETLQAMGVGLSLDDFGTGYSGLTVLARVPFNEVKIDRTMVALLHDERMHSAIELAVESARRYGASFVAEGVETQEQAEALLKMGITIGQGYLFSPAVPIETLLELMHTPASTDDTASPATGALPN